MLHAQPAESGPERDRDLRAALRLEALTVAWMTVEAVASLIAGFLAGSLLLVAFGADSVVELVSAVVVFWRLWLEARGAAQNQSVLDARERKVARLGGYLLFALSLYVVVQAGYGLLHPQQPETSWVGLGVAAVAALGTPVLARAKLRLADRIGSRALRADAMETLTCGYLSWVLLAGLLGNAILHWWWLDSAISLLIVPLLLREAWEAVKGEGCCDQGA